MTEESTENLTPEQLARKLKKDAKNKEKMEKFLAKQNKLVNFKVHF